MPRFPKTLRSSSTFLLSVNVADGLTETLGKGMTFAFAGVKCRTPLALGAPLVVAVPPLPLLAQTFDGQYPLLQAPDRSLV